MGHEVRIAGVVAAWALLASVSAGCVEELEETSGEDQATQPPPAVDVAARRSLAITEQPILARFPLERVLDQIVSTSGVEGATSLGLFQQWWDTQNPGPGLGLGAHCDDTVADGGPLLNGFAYTCRPAPAEGFQATCDPFTDPDSPCAYIPIGLFMRFDLAPGAGTHCGEYRIVYAKRTGQTVSNDRNLLIFEAAMRNPHYNQGIRGCKKLVSAWADLSEEDDLEARADQLEEIYFDGLAEFDPVVQASNFGDNPFGAGQVRTNQFVQPVAPRIWSLREFKIATQCAAGGDDCALRFVPVSSKTNPFGPLFDGASTHPSALAFQTELVTQVARLAGSTLGGISMNTSDTFNSAQSQASSSVTETNFVANFGTSASPLRDAIQAELTSLGSSLTPDDIVARSQAMSCAGCHRFSNGAAIGGGLTWPSSLGFVHISEKDVDLEIVDGVTRYRISPALTDAFLPHRAALVEDFLADIPHPEQPPDDPIGGRWTH